MFPRRISARTATVARKRRTTCPDGIIVPGSAAPIEFGASPGDICAGRFDTGDADIRLPSEAASSGERRRFDRRGGTSWELEGTSPRLFMRCRLAISTRRYDCPPCRIVWRMRPVPVVPPIKSRCTDQNLLTAPKALFIRKNDAGSLISGRRAIVRLVSEKQQFFTSSERPHECQIGSGEAIRNAGRVTFESRRTRSSDSRRRFPPRLHVPHPVCRRTQRDSIRKPIRQLSFLSNGIRPRRREAEVSAHWPILPVIRRAMN